MFFKYHHYQTVLLVKKRNTNRKTKKKARRRRRSDPDFLQFPPPFETPKNATRGGGSVAKQEDQINSFLTSFHFCEFPAWCKSTHLRLMKKLGDFESS